MQRRTAIQKLATLLGGLALTPEIMAGIAARVAAGDTPQQVSADRLAILAELADTIIPDTDTPGAKAAGVPQFISILVQDCMKPDESAAFWAALDACDRDCQKQLGKSFTACNTAERTTFLKGVEADAKTKPDPDFWRMLKGMTLFSYFTSEIGMTQALAYDPIPGGWIPEMKIDDHTKAWAGMF